MKSTHPLLQITQRFALAALLAVALSSLQAVVIVSDDFSTNFTDREPGDTLNGVQVQVGGIYWEAPTASEFVSGGGVTANTTGNNGGSVKLKDNFTLNTYVSLTTTVKPTGSDWAGVGFGQGGLNSSSWFGNVQVWVLFTSGGAWNLWGNGTAVATGSGVGLDNGFATITLKYTFATNVAEYSIVGDGTGSVSGSYDFDDVSFSPNTDYAGFQFQPTVTANSPLITNFEVATVPEPGVLTLLGIGGAWLLIARRRPAAGRLG